MTNEEFIESIRLEGEEWRDAPDLSDVCMVSNYGRVVSKGRQVNSGYGTTRWKKPKLQLVQKGSKGYCSVHISKNGVSKPYLVHRLVAFAFLPNPENKPTIDHIDCDPSNNCVDNLRWCTQKENMQNPISHDRVKRINKGRERPERYNPILAIKDGVVQKSYRSAKFATDDGHKPECIYQACIGKRKTYHGMIWMYLSDYESLVQYIKDLQ